MRSSPLAATLCVIVAMLLQLYFWESAKWLRRIQFTISDHKGFWNGQITTTTATHGRRSAMTETLAWDFGFSSIDEGRLDFAAFKGRVLLVVNTASFCGYTYQYEAMEKLHRSGTPRGLTVVGVPSRDFNQESADNKTVKTFCEATFGVQFPAKF